MSRKSNLTFEEGGCKIILKANDHIMCISLKDRKELKRLALECKKTPTDIKLQMGGHFSPSQVVGAHKQVLIEHVDYFKAMFSDNFAEASKSAVDIGDIVDMTSVKTLVGFFYKGSMKVSAADAQGMFILSDLWGMAWVRAACVKFMEWELDASNCLDLLQLAKTHSCDSLVSACNSVIGRCFQAVTHTTAFLDLSSRDLIDNILKVDGLDCGLRGMDVILESVLRWCEHDIESRRGVLSGILDNVAIDQISQMAKASYLQDSSFVFKEELVMSFKNMDKHPTNVKTHNQKFMVICGFLQSRTGPNCPKTSSVEIYNPDTGFSKCADIPWSLAYSVAMNLMGTVTVVGVGTHEQLHSSTINHLTQVYIYSPLFDKWLERDEMFTGYGKPTIPRKMFTEEAVKNITDCLVNKGTVVHCPFKNLIYAVSVSQAVVINVECNDGEISCHMVKHLPSLGAVLEESHKGLRGVSVNGVLYVLGGFWGPDMDQNISQKVLRLTGDEWEEVEPMTTPRRDFGLAAIGDNIFVTGGYGNVGDSQPRRMQSCECYSVRANKWSKIWNMSQSRSHHTTLVLGSTLYSIGGKTYASQKHTQHYHGWNAGGARIVSNIVEVAPLTLHQGEINPSLLGTFLEWERKDCLSKARCDFASVVI